jgi:hypothetical protein
MKQTSMSVAKAQTGKRLPIEYTIGEYDVNCGRGTAAANHIGNQRFNAIVQDNLIRYCNASNRNQKTSLIYEIVDFIRARSPNGGFVKQNTKSGHWFEVGDIVAVSTIVYIYIFFGVSVVF